jgi:hypothetical protein
VLDERKGATASKDAVFTRRVFYARGQREKRRDSVVIIDPSVVYNTAALTALLPVTR